jgi:hypothetical protein
MLQIEKGAEFQHSPNLGVADTVLSAVNGVHLCDAAVNKLFRSRAVAGVVGVRNTRAFAISSACRTSRRNAVGNHLFPFPPTSQDASSHSVRACRFSRVESEFLVAQPAAEVFREINDCRTRYASLRKPRQRVSGINRSDLLLRCRD